MLPRVTFIYVTEKVFYHVLLGVGIFFIYQGDVITRYWLKRTNFAEFSEPLAELPTILAFSDPPESSLSLQKDFNISLGVFKGKKIQFTQLKKGRNSAGDGQLIFNLENVYNENTVRVTPLGTNTNFKLIYGLKFQLKHSNQSKGQFIDIGLIFSTENNSITWAHSEKDFDGDGDNYNVKLGQQILVTFQVEKIKYLIDVEPCRDKPFNEVMFSKISMANFSNCSKLCRQNISYGEILDKIINPLPICAKVEEEKCFDDIAMEIRENMVDKPCTKVQFKGKSQTYNLKNTRDTAIVIYKFANPPKILVREEYLIYDGVAMISAIGGTLGLCIGFSFTEFLTTALKLLNQFTRKKCEQEKKY